MKKVLLLLSFIPVFLTAQTIQGSFKIINNKHPESEAFYISSIEKASMESYRLQSEEVTLKFENGFECVLLSAKQVFLIGKIINVSTYLDKFSVDYSLPTFTVLESGQLIAVYPTKTKRFEK